MKLSHKALVAAVAASMGMALVAVPTVGLVWAQSGQAEKPTPVKIERESLKGSELTVVELSDQLQANMKELVAVRNRLQGEYDRIFEKENQNREERERVCCLLTHFRAEYQAGQREGFPRKIFDRCYTEQEVVQRVEKLLERQQSLEPSQAATLNGLILAKAKVEARIQETQRHLESMPVYRVLAQTDDAMKRQGESSESLAACVQENAGFLRQDDKAEMEMPWVGLPVPAEETPKVIHALEFLKDSQTHTEVPVSTHIPVPLLMQQLNEMLGETH
jgi:hypothetical protein